MNGMHRWWRSAVSERVAMPQMSALAYQRALEDVTTKQAPTLAEEKAEISAPAAEAAEAPLVFDLASLRACRASLGSERALHTDAAALVELIAASAYEAGMLEPWQAAKLPMQRRVRGGVRKGLEKAGVIRS
jgi:hypothetical protein